MALFPQIVSCDCGQVQYLAKSQPIVTAVCYCIDCQTAASIIGDIENVKPFCDADGGTQYVTLRDKDWQALRGEGLLHSVKLKPGSPTTRFVTTCCNSPMFIKYKPGFWTSTYRNRYDNPPALEWRNKTEARNPDRPYPDDLPRFKTFPLRLFGRLLKARFF